MAEVCGARLELRRALSTEEREQLRRAPGSVPTSLSKEDREKLLADAVAGDKFVKLEVEAVTFIQREAPNRNYTRFTPGALQRMAPSFAGMPVLRDHRQSDSLARAGLIRESKLEDSGDDGAKQIRMTLELTAPWAVEAALRGLMDRFSIGWHPTGPTECSICGSEMFWFWCMGKGDHFLGDTYDGQVCELVYTAADGIEVSTVSVPAVVGTGVDDIRAQLSAARAAGPAGLGRREISMKTFAIIAAALSLGADAEATECIGAIDKLKLELEGARAAAKDASERATKAEGELVALAAAGKQSRIDALLARGLDEGRFLPKSRSEEHAQKLAKRGDEEGLAAFVDDLPKAGAAPLRVVRQSSAPAGADVAPPAGATELTDNQKKTAKQMGVTEEAYAEQLAKLNAGGR